jgi:hypothetical protein
MQTKAKIALFCTAVLLIAAAVFGSMFALDLARTEKAKYIESEERLVLIDLSDALGEMENALKNGDVEVLNRAAGRAEAYLTRADLGDVHEAYRLISLILAGECGVDECRILADAAEAALKGDGGAAFRALSERDAVNAAEETTEDMLASRMLERIGKGRDDVALARAAAFACPNAVFDEAVCTDGCFKYSGDNIFIAVGGSNSRVLMYCFERDVDPRYSVSEEEAINTALNVVKREKLKLRGEAHTELHDGIYRSVWYDDESKDPIVVLEVYSDTGRLRLYNAANYYKSLG